MDTVKKPIFKNNFNDGDEGEVEKKQAAKIIPVVKDPLSCGFEEVKKHIYYNPKNDISHDKITPDEKKKEIRDIEYPDPFNEPDPFDDSPMK